MLPLMRRTRTVTLDFDWLWRVGLPRVASAVLALLVAGNALLARARDAGGHWLAVRLGRHFGTDGTFARSWPIGTTALWLAVLLSLYVLIHYL
jgi:multicomponent Na+:H+ antiporter subunit D